MMRIMDVLCHETGAPVAIVLIKREAARKDMIAFFGQPREGGKAVGLPGFDDLFGPDNFAVASAGFDHVGDLAENFADIDDFGGGIGGLAGHRFLHQNDFVANRDFSQGGLRFHFDLLLSFVLVRREVPFNVKVVSFLLYRLDGINIP
jgi:hypothetical protein